MSSDTVIKVENLSKCYQIYEKPRDRLKQFVLPQIQRLSRRVEKQYYKDFWALRDISFEVKRGESVGILGRNGCGKSTLLQLISGTLNPTHGTVETKGRVAALLELGAGFNPEFSGRENVYLNAALLGFTREQIDERFDAIAAFADIGEFVDRPVKTYSSGMLVRLAFAVQVQVEPDILIVDEALAVGDALFQKRCFQRIEKLLNEGVTLLFVSHDIESIRTLTNKAVLLKDGSLVKWGVSSDVVLAYRKQLHDEEAAYFSNLVRTIATETKMPDAGSIGAVPDGRTEGGSDKSTSGQGPTPAARSDKLSFGDGGVEIVRVETLNGNNTPCSAFYPNDKIKIRVVCRSRIEIDRLNVAIRIRNKEGYKIYSWGTLNQDMVLAAAGEKASLFWSKRVYPGDEFDVILESTCCLGQNLYEIQASISYEETPDYRNQRILHWRDEAAYFKVFVKSDEYFFGGLFDLQMKAVW